MVFHSSLLRFVGFLERVKGIPEEREALWDYRSKKDQYEYSLMKVALKNLLKEDLSSFRKDNKEVISQVEAEMKKLALSQDLDGMRRIAARLQELEKSLPQPKEEDLTFHLRNVPADISEEIKADLRELEKCYDAGCYRATIILCGRILETALHWVYYTLTKNDLLEKSPGIGLGNIIAKLKEQGVALDPALTQQVHLVNQVRIYSVHKKQEPYIPSKQQCYPIILYTLEIAKSLFDIKAAPRKVPGKEIPQR